MYQPFLIEITHFESFGTDLFFCMFLQFSATKMYENEQKKVKKNASFYKNLPSASNLLKNLENFQKKVKNVTFYKTSLAHPIRSRICKKKCFIGSTSKNKGN